MQRKKVSSLTAGQAQLKPVRELADVLRSVRRLLLDYGPAWYTAETDDQVRKALAEADSALHVVVDEALQQGFVAPAQQQHLTPRV